MKQKAVVYTRISTDKNIQKTSLITQEEYYTDYCERKGYELVKVYADEGLTGTNARRENFISMLHDGALDYKRNENSFDSFEKSTRKPKYDILICKDVSRFSRGSIQGQTIVKHLKDKGVNTVFENSGMSTFDDNWEFNIGLLFQIAQNESASMSKRIKFSKKHSSDKGVYKPGRLPHGYMRTDLNEIVIDETQAEIIRYIFERYTEVGANIIAKELLEKKAFTPQGKLWTPDKIGRVISSKVYTGIAEVGKSFKNSVTDVKRTKKNKEDFIEIPNAVPPIISMETFEEADRVRASRINVNKKLGRRPAKNDLYHGKLRCERCGSSFVRHIGHGKKITYICSNRRKNLGCKIKGIAVNKLDNFIAEIDLSIYLNDMSDNFYYKKLITQLDNQKKKLSDSINIINSQIKGLEEDTASTLQAFKKHLKDSSDVIRKLLEHDMEVNAAKINELQAQLGKLNIESIERVRLKVEAKKVMINQMVNSKTLNKEDKYTLLKMIDIGDYELKFHFSLPSYEEEIDQFNSIFPMNPIKSDIPFKPFTDTFRRTHKESREFWESVDENNEEI